MEQYLSQAVAILVPLATIAAPPIAVSLFGGLLPRVGPGRAVALALGTFRPGFVSSKDTSQRVDDVQTLRGMLSNAHADQYVIVSGPKGIGKTCLVKSALQSTFGVVYVPVEAGTTSAQIKADTFTAVTRSYFSMINLAGSARRVMWWHHFIFRTPVTIVLQAAERKPSEPFAPLDRVARELTQNFGGRVIIDASNNSLPDTATATKREILLQVEAMPQSLVEQLPELEPLHTALKEADLSDVVWACVGGNPADYRGLLGAWERRSCQDIELVVASFVPKLITNAVYNVRAALASKAELKILFGMFRERSEVPYSVLTDKKLVRPSPDNVLRVVQRTNGSCDRILVPADAATSVVLRYGLTTPLDLKALKAILRK